MAVALTRLNELYTGNISKHVSKSNVNLIAKTYLPSVDRIKNLNRNLSKAFVNFCCSCTSSYNPTRYSAFIRSGIIYKTN